MIESDLSDWMICHLDVFSRQQEGIDIRRELPSQIGIIAVMSQVSRGNIFPSSKIGLILSFIYFL